MSNRSILYAQNDTNPYPPYCELCLVKFMTNYNASLHFNGPQHQNRVILAFHRQPKENLIWCKLCCCELNTEKALELHNQSPKHKKKEEAFHEIAEMKKEYLKTIEQGTVVVVVGDKIETLEADNNQEYTKSGEISEDTDKSKKKINEFELD
jgi:hypothetical protein